MALGLPEGSIQLQRLRDKDEPLDEAWSKISTHPEVIIDVPPEPMRPGSATRHFLVFIPGGIRLELATPFTKA